MIKNKINYFTTSEAALSLGFSTEHIRKLILQGKVKAEKLGRNWIIEKKNLQKIHRLRFPKKKEKESYGSNE